MTKFYCIEQRPTTLAGGQKGIAENVAVEISEKEAVELSNKFCLELLELQKLRPELEKQFQIQDKKCIEIAGEVLKLREANSAFLRETEEKLGKAKVERDRPTLDFKRNRDLLLSEIEKLNSEPISETTEKWREKRISLHRNVEVQTTKQERTLDGQKIFSIRTNRKVLKGGLERILESEHILMGMQARPLSEILNYIKDCEKEFAKFNFSEMEEMIVTEPQYRDLRGVKETTGPFDTTMIIGDKAIPIRQKEDLVESKGILLSQEEMLGVELDRLEKKWHSPKKG